MCDLASAQDPPAPADGQTRLPVPDNPSPLPAPHPPTYPNQQPRHPPAHPRPAHGISIISANVRGLGELEKVSGLYRDFRSLKADVIFVQETKLTDSKADYPQLLWREPSVFGNSPTAAQGVAVLFGANTPLSPQPKRALVTHRFIAVPATWEDLPYLFINVYAPNDPGERSILFQEIWDLLHASDLLDPVDLRVIWGGDFNSVDRPALDKLTPNEASVFPWELRTAIEELDLTDTFRLLHPQKREFSWYGPTTATRIDYLFASRNLADRIVEVGHTHNPFSDHKTITMTLRPDPRVSIGHGLWRLQPGLLASPVARDAFSKEARRLPVNAFDSANDWFTSLLPRLKNTALKLTARAETIKQAKLRDLHERLSSLETRLSASPSHPTLRLSIKATKSAIYREALAKRSTDQAHSAARFFKEGEKCSKYFASFAKKRNSENTIKKLLRPDGTEATTTQEILATATEFYQNLYSPAATDPEAQDLLLSNLTRRLQPDQAEVLDALISPQEVAAAIKEASGSKAPGPDGMPPELWKSLPNIETPLAALFNEWFAKGSIPDSAKEGVVTLLYKKGDPREIKNYRPITLLNTVLKVLTRTLNNRLKRVMGDLISPAQTGMAGRYIGETTRTMADLLSHARSNQTPLGLLLLDQEKAFDKVSHSFLQAVLLALGFGPSFRTWISLLYDHPSSKLKINNTLGDTFCLLRGVRQGDCLSPNLFVLVLEPFLQAIIRDPTILGYPVPGGPPLKVMAFADDTTPVTSTTDDIPRFVFWMETYERATGATFSKSKSELLLLGLPPPEQNYFFAPQNVITDPLHTFTYLGVPMSLRLDPEEAWGGAIMKMERCLNLWRGCALSLHGKAVVLKHFAYPILTYLAQVLPMPKPCRLKVHNLAWKYFWGGKKAKVNVETAKLPSELGGAGFPVFEDLLKKIHCRWMTRLLKDWESSKPWTALAKHHIAQVNAKWGHGASTIITPGNHQIAATCPSQFWASSLTAFWETNPRYELRNDVQSSFLARSTPLFRNPLLKHHGQTLSGPRWEPLVLRGIRRLCDLIFFDRVGTYEELVQYYGHLPKPAVRDLLEAIPQDLLRIACMTPPLIPSSEWAHTTNYGHRLYILEEPPADTPLPSLPFASVWYLSDPATRVLFYSVPVPSRSRTSDPPQPPSSTTVESRLRISTTGRSTPTVSSPVHPPSTSFETQWSKARRHGPRPSALPLCSRSTGPRSTARARRPAAPTSGRTPGGSSPGGPSSSVTGPPSVGGRGSRTTAPTAPTALPLRPWTTCISPARQPWPAGAGATPSGKPAPTGTSP